MSLDPLIKQSLKEIREILKSRGMVRDNDDGKEKLNDNDRDDVSDDDGNWYLLHFNMLILSN